MPATQRRNHTSTHSDNESQSGDQSSASANDDSPRRLAGLPRATPVWLRGVPPRFVRAYAWFLVILVVLSVYGFWTVFILRLLPGKGDKINRRICPNIIPCTNLCVVEAVTSWVSGCVRIFDAWQSEDAASFGQVRVAIYIQSICGVVLLGFSAEDITAVRTSFSVTTFSLVLCGNIFWWQGKLSLAHAIAVTSLTTTMLLPLYLAGLSQIKSKLAFYLVDQLRLVLYLLMTLVLTFEAPCFGSDPQCNLCVRVAFGPVRTRAVGALSQSVNYFIAFVTGALNVGDFLWFYGPWIYVRTVLAMFSRRHREEWKLHVNTSWFEMSRFVNEDSDMPERIGARVARWSLDASTLRDHLGPLRRPPPRRFRDWRRWARWLAPQLKTVLHVPRCQRTFAAFLIIGFLIHRVETTVRLNLSDKANDWSYGQMLALVMSVQPIAATVRLLVELKNYWSPDVGRGAFDAGGDADSQLSSDDWANTTQTLA